MSYAGFCDVCNVPYYEMDALRHQHVQTSASQSTDAKKQLMNELQKEIRKLQPPSTVESAPVSTFGGAGLGELPEAVNYGMGFTPAASTDERLAEIAERESKAGAGPWWPGCFVEEGTTCKCRYILSEGQAGAIAEIGLDNGLPIAEGGNDDPPLDEAIANCLFIVHARADIPYLLRLVAELRSDLNSAGRAIKSAASIAEEWMKRAEQAERERDDARECLLGAQQSSINNRVDSGKWETVARSVYAQYQNEQNCRVANQDSARRLESELATARQRIAVLEGGNG